MSPTTDRETLEGRAALTLAYLPREGGQVQQQESDRSGALCVGVLSLAAGRIQAAVNWSGLLTGYCSLEWMVNWSVLLGFGLE
eukprot:2603506-Amphidinium_carterae.1